MDEINDDFAGYRYRAGDMRESIMVNPAAQDDPSQPGSPVCRFLEVRKAQNVVVFKRTNEYRLCWCAEPAVL